MKGSNDVFRIDCPDEIEKAYENSKKNIKRRHLHVFKSIATYGILITMGLSGFKLMKDSGLITDIKSDIDNMIYENNAKKDAKEESNEGLTNDFIQKIPEEKKQEEVKEEPHEIIDTSLYDAGYEFNDTITPSYLKSLNPDNSDNTCWLDIPNTDISYSVVHPDESKFDSVEDANSYYLHHNLSGNNSSNGTVYIDARDEALDQSDINTSDITYIYGHHMKESYSGDKMFRSLMNYKNDSYGEEHDKAIIYTDDGYGYEVEFIAGNVVSGNSESVLHINDFNSTEEKESYINNFIDDARKSNMYVNDNYEFSDDDKYVGLITCSYENENDRFILLGKKNKIKVRNDDNNYNLNGYYVEENKSSSLSR